MKSANVILKALAAVAAVVGVVFLVATYGDKIVAWFKRLLGKDACKCEDCECEGDCDACECEDDCEECECCCECEEVAEEAAEEAAEEVVAAEADFEE